MNHTLTPGSTQFMRLIRALSPDSFKIDDRTWQDFITSAHRYAEWLTYYNEQNQPCGHWAGFWEQEALTYLAVLAALDTDQLRRDYEEIEIRLAEEMEEFLQADESAPAPNTWADRIRELVEHIRKTATLTEQVYIKLSHLGHPLADMLYNLIKKDNAGDFEELTGDLQRLISYNLAADPTLPDAKYALFYDVQLDRDEHGNIPDEPEPVKPEDARWGVVGITRYHTIPSHGELPTREELRALFIQFLETLIVLKTRAQREFEAELARMEQPERELVRIVQPHIALFITFLHLFRHVQDDMNALPAKHLTYYYEDVLGLTRRAAQPDHAYLVFQLAKGIPAEFIEKGALLIGGKDGKGKPLFYETLYDWTVRAAQVAEIRNTFIDIATNYPENEAGKYPDFPIYDPNPPGGMIRANPDTKKSYQDGEEDPNVKPVSWRSMGDDPALPEAEIGFAIASPQLILKEGKRVVDVKIALKETDGNVISSEFADVLTNVFDPNLSTFSPFKLFLSSDKEWISPELNKSMDCEIAIDSANQVPQLEKASYKVQFITGEQNGEYSIKFRIILESDDLPIVQPGEKFAAKTGFNTPWPILKVVIDHKDDGVPGVPAAMYRLLRNLRAEEISIRVAAFGIRENLIIQSDRGVFDGTQKVYPFGPVPEVNNRFYIGSTEIFQKALQKLDVHFNWIDPPTNFSEYYDEYNTVLQKTPNPYVQIDFIDRADMPNLRQIAVKNVTPHNGTSSIIIKISGRIIDKNGTPLFNVKITDGVTSIFTNAEGQYQDFTISISDWSNPPKLVFSKYQDSDNSLLDNSFEPLEAVPVVLEESTTGTKNLATEVDIILFPRHIDFQQYEKKLKGKVKDIYGKELTGIEVTAGSTKTETTPLGLYALDFSGNPPNSISFKDPSKKQLSLEDIETQQFTILDVVLYPNQSPQITEFNPQEGFIEGIITKAGTDEKIGKSLMIEALLNDGSKILTKCKETGEFILPYSNKIQQLSFPQNSVNLPLELTDDYRNNIFQAPLIAQKVIPEAEEKEITISGYVLDAESSAIISQGVKQKIDENNSIDLDFKDDNSYIIEDVPKKSKILFSCTNYQNVLIYANSDNKIDVYLSKIKCVHEAHTNASNTSLVIKAVDRNDAPIAGLQIKTNTSGNFETNDAGQFTYESAPGGHIVELSHSNFDVISLDESLEYNNLESAGIITIRLNAPLNRKLTTSASATTDIEIDLAYFNGISSVDIIFQQSNNSGYYEQKNISNNSFKFTFPSETGTWDITAYKKDINKTYKSQLNEVAVGSKIELIVGLVTKQRPFRGSVSGEVTNPKEVPLEGVLVKAIGSDLWDVTDKNGIYKINNLLADTNYTLSFFHPSFYQLTEVPVEDDSDINVILMPLRVTRILQGTLTDIQNQPIQGVEIGLMDTVNNHSFKVTKSGFGGQYELSIPDDKASSDAEHDWLSNIRFPYFKYSGFETYLLKETALIEHVFPENSLSYLNLLLFYDNLNYIPILENQGIKNTFAVNISALNLSRDTRTQLFTKYEPTLKRGFIRLTLAESDFLHKEYQKVLLLHSLNAAEELDLSADPPNIPALPNPPYTPSTNGISVDYISEQAIFSDNIDIDGNPIDNPIDGYFHVFPFNGNKRIPIENTVVTIQKTDGTQEELKAMIIPLVNAFAPSDSPDHAGLQAFGNLYIGLTDLEPGATLSLLVQVAEGSEVNPDDRVPAVYWSYLTKNNHWEAFKPYEIISDGTNGLTRSGIIRLNIPPAASRVGNTMLPAERWWLRAACAKPVGEVSDLTRTELRDMNAGAFPSLISIEAQAIEVQFHDSGTDLQHLAKPLPDGSITRLAASRSVVKEVRQPIPSHDGRLPETAGEEYFRRVSERLRHKDRAVTPYDYERLTLERYGAVLTAKAIPHARYDKKTECKAPGFVTVAVIPLMRQRPPELRRTPRLPKGELLEIEKFLLGKATLHLQDPDEARNHLQVLNPLYEEIRIEVTLKFTPDADVVMAKHLTEEALKDFIAPWVKDVEQYPAFGGTIYRSQLMALLEGLSFVDFVEILEAYRVGDPNETDILADNQFVIEPTTARSILTTAKAHVIDGDNKPVPVSMPSSASTGTGGDKDQSSLNTTVAFASLAATPDVAEQKRIGKAAEKQKGRPSPLKSAQIKAAEPATKKPESKKAPAKKTEKPSKPATPKGGSKKKG